MRRREAREEAERGRKRTDPASVEEEKRRNEAMPSEWHPYRLGSSSCCKHPGRRSCVERERRKEEKKESQARCQSGLYEERRTRTQRRLEALWVLVKEVERILHDWVL